MEAPIDREPNPTCTPTPISSMMMAHGDGILIHPHVLQELLSKVSSMTGHVAGLARKVAEFKPHPPAPPEPRSPGWWCVHLRDGELLSIGTRSECERYITQEKHQMVRRVLPLQTVVPTHFLLKGPQP